VFLNNRDFFFFLMEGLFILNCPLLQKHDLSGATELRGGLRGGHQPSDQHGAVCFLCLPFNGESPKPLQRDGGKEH